MVCYGDKSVDWFVKILEVAGLASFKYVSTTSFNGICLRD